MLKTLNFFFKHWHLTEVLFLSYYFIIFMCQLLQSQVLNKMSSTSVLVRMTSSFSFSPLHFLVLLSFFSFHFPVFRLSYYITTFCQILNIFKKILVFFVVPSMPKRWIILKIFNLIDFYECENFLLQ